MILQAAILIECVIHTLPRPNRHHHIIEHMGDMVGPFLIARGVQGFLDSEEGFVTRERAAAIAIRSNQLLREKLIAPPQLYSEDLW